MKKLHCAILITTSTGSVAAIAPESAESNLYQAQQSTVSTGYRATREWVTVRGLKKDSLTAQEINSALDGLCDFEYNAVLLDPKKTIPSGDGWWNHHVQLWVAHPSRNHVSCPIGFVGQMETSPEC